MYEFLFQIGAVLLLLVLGYGVGRWRERRHLASLTQREAHMAGMVVTDLKVLPEGCAPSPGTMVTGSVVIASDYFKSFAARLKSLVGGELLTFQTLLSRGRREAVLRMLEEAYRLGANQVINVRITTSTIGNATQQQNISGMVEVLAYGTAIHVPGPDAATADVPA